jgi:hypothetical protein
MVLSFKRPVSWGMPASGSSSETKSYHFDVNSNSFLNHPVLNTECVKRNLSLLYSLDVYVTFINAT